MRERCRRLITGRPVATAIALTLAWHAVLFALVEPLESVGPGWFPDLGPTLINLGAAAVPIGLALWLGWGRASGFGRPCPDRTWWLLTPAVLEALAYAVPGLDADPTRFISAAVLFAVLGISEEALSRGLVQKVLTPLGRYRSAIGVAVLFGLGHVLSGLWFERPIDEVAYICVNAAAFGFALAALRRRIGTIWPLAAVHGLGDHTQILSPGNLPEPVRIAFMIGHVAYGWWLLRTEEEQEPVPGGIPGDPLPAAGR